MIKHLNNTICVIFGCDVQASAIAINLKKVGFSVIMVANEKQIILRRKLSFYDALNIGKKSINNTTAQILKNDFERNEDSSYEQNIAKEINLLQKDNCFPLLSMIEYSIYQKLHPSKILIHTLCGNDNLPEIDMAKLVISLNPNAIPGINCHLYIEASLTEQLGELFWTQSNLYQNKEINDELYKIKAPKEGVFVSLIQIGDIVKKGRNLGEISGKKIDAPCDGKIIGLKHSGEFVAKNESIIEIDKNEFSKKDNEFSLKIRFVSMSVLQGILIALKNLDE